MRRRLFTVTSALSLLLCITTAALWVWSYAQPKWQTGTAGPAPARYRELALGGGYFAVSTTEMFARTSGVGAGYPYGSDVSGWKAMGLQWRHTHMRLLHPENRSVVATVYRATTFSVWLGVPLFLSAVLPVWWLIWNRKINREKRRGTCRVCGYDLRASKKRCPECGTPITSIAV